MLYVLGTHLAGAALPHDQTDGRMLQTKVFADLIDEIPLIAEVEQVLCVHEGHELLLLSQLATRPLVSIFARPGNPVYDLAVTGNRICSIALLFIGFNVFASGMFTALSNGIVSAILAFSRSFVFMIIAMLTLPALLGVTGVWLANPIAELAAIGLATFMLVRYRKRYGY